MSQEEELDIKNLRTMADVWLVLNREYRASEDPVNESVNSLKHFAFSNSAKTVPEKFRELYLCYKQVRSDLVEVDQLEVLNHEPTLWSVIKKLPSQDCKNRFVEFRSTRKESHTHLEVLSEFLDQENGRQKDLASLLRTEGPGESKSNSSSGVTCHACGDKGHVKRDCKKFKSKTVNSTTS